MAVGPAARTTHPEPPSPDALRLRPSPTHAKLIVGHNTQPGGPFRIQRTATPQPPTGQSRRRSLEPQLAISGAFRHPKA